jgi:hypothetical protein
MPNYLPNVVKNIGKNSTYRLSPTFFIITILLTVFGLLQIAPKIAHAQTGNLTIYGTGNTGDLLAPGWVSKNIYGRTDLTNRTAPYAGTSSMAWTATTAWDEFTLTAPSPINTSQYQFLNVAVKITQAGQSYEISLLDQAGKKIGTALNLSQFGALTPNNWAFYSIPLSQLGGGAQVGGVGFREASGGAQPPVYIDEVVLSSTQLTPAPQAQTSSPAPTNLSADVPEEEVYSACLCCNLFRLITK